MKSVEAVRISGHARIVDPYPISLVGLPSLFGPVCDAVQKAVGALPFRFSSPSSSPEGLAIDHMVAATREELDRVLDQADKFVPDLAFALRPQRRTFHRGRVVVRNAPLRYAGGPTDLSHLDNGRGL